MDEFKSIALNEITKLLREQGATEHDCAVTKAFIITAIENLDTYQSQLSNTELGTPVIKSIADMYYIFA